MWFQFHKSKIDCKENLLICEKMLPFKKESSTVVWQIVGLQTRTDEFTTHTITWQLTHFSLGCYFQMLQRDEQRKRWKK